jgi:hypothetical protein
MQLRSILLFVLCWSGTLSSFAVHFPGDSARFSAGLAGGTLGYGVEGAWRLNHRWQFRLGFTRVAYKKPFDVDANKESTFHLQPLVRMNLLHAGANWVPFRKSSFYLTGGLALQIDPSYSVSGNTLTGLHVDAINISPEEFGQARLSLKWWPVIPHLGLGFGRAVPKKRIGVSFEMGCHYLGSPKINFWTDGLVESTTLPDQIPKIEHNMWNYSYLPYLMLYVRYRLPDRN